MKIGYYVLYVEINKITDTERYRVDQQIDKREFEREMSL